MWLCVALIGCGVIGLVFYLLEKCHRYSLRGVLIKSVVSLCFLAVAILNGFIVFGLALGLLGDIWLDLKYVYPKDSKAYTYSGFIVFGIGHILFVTGMMMEFYEGGNMLYFLIPIGASFLFAIAIFILAKPLKLDFGNYKWIVAIYAFLLAMNPATALLVSIHAGWQSVTTIMLLCGGVLFAISDLVLSGTYFGEGKERPIDFILNYLTYYSAQFTIAFSIMFL